MKSRFRRLFESFPDAIVIVDERGHIMQANTQAASLFGHGRGSRGRSRDRLFTSPTAPELTPPTTSGRSHPRPRQRAPAREAGRIAGEPDPPGTAILALMTRGADNRAVAEDLHISYATVRTHAHSILAKLGARSKLDAVAKPLSGVSAADSPPGQDTRQASAGNCLAAGRASSGWSGRCPPWVP